MTDAPKKSFIGRLIRFFLILIVLLVVLVAIAPMFFSGMIKEKIAGAMEEQLDAKVEIGEFSFGWFSAVEVRDFSMTQPDHDEPSLEIGSLTTAPSFGDVLSGKFIVDDIVAEDVIFRAERRESGVDWKDIRRKDVPKKTTTKESSELPEFLVKAEVKNLRVIYKDPKLERPFDLAGFNVKVDLERAKDMLVKIAGPDGIAADMSFQLFDGNSLKSTKTMTGKGQVTIGQLDLGAYAPHLAQFLAELGGTVKGTQSFTYGPNGEVSVQGTTEFANLVAGAAAGGLSSRSGSITSKFTMNDDGKTVSADLVLQDSQVVGMPNQTKPVPCGQGQMSLTYDVDQVVTFTKGQFAIPGGSLNMTGSYGIGEKQGSGINLNANTDLAIWSNYFTDIPALKGKVNVRGVVPADMVKTPLKMDAKIDSLYLTGGPLEEKAYVCGPTDLSMKVTMPYRPGGPRKIDLSSKSRMWTIDVKSSLAADETAAFGFLGQAGIKGNCDMEQFLAPFTDSRGQGTVSFDFLANMTKDEFAVSGAKLRGPAARGTLTARIGRSGEEWRMVVGGDDFTYKRGDGIGLVIPKVESRSTWNKATNAIQGRASLKNIRTLGGQGPAVQGGDVNVDFNGTVDQEAGAYNLNFSKLNLAGFSGTGAVDYRKDSGLGMLKINGMADYAEISSRWLRLFDDRATGTGTGPVVIELDPQGGDWKNARGRLEMKVPGLKSYGFTVSDLVVKGAMQNGKGSITEGSGRLNDGTVKLTGNVDMTGDEMVFSSAADMKRVRIVKEWQPAIARVIPLFAGIGVTAEGFINLDLTADGKGDDWTAIKPRLNGNGALGLLNGRIAGAPILEALGLALGFNPNMAIKDIESAFAIKNGGVHQDGLIADLGSLQIKMAGTTYLDGRLDYDLGIKPVSQQPRNWQRYVALLSGDGFLPLKLRGNVSSPEPGLPDPGKLIEAGAKKLIGDKLGDLLNPGAQGQDGKKSGVGGLLEGLTGGDKNKDNKKSNSSNPLNGLLNGLGGGKKKDPKKKDDTKKKKPNVGGFLNDVLGGGKKKEKK